MSSKFSLAIENFRESDLFWSFKHSPIAILALCVTIVLMFSALFAQLIAPFNPYDLASLDLMDAHMPPSFSEGGDSRFWLGTCRPLFPKAVTADSGLAQTTRDAISSPPSFTVCGFR